MPVYCFGASARHLLATYLAEHAMDLVNTQSMQGHTDEGACPLQLGQRI